MDVEGRRREVAGRCRTALLMAIHDDRMAIAEMIASGLVEGQ